MALQRKYVLKRFADEFGDDIKDEIKQHWSDEEYDDDMFEDPDEDVIPDSLNDKKYFEFLKKVINDNSNANPKFDPNKFEFKLKRSKIEEYKKLYKEHCSVLVPGGQAEDLSLATLISVGAFHEYPFMQNLIDAYERTRLHLWNNNNEDGYYDYKFVKFAKEDCKFLVDLQKGNKSVWDFMVAGCNSFYKRLFTQTQLGKSKRILDDYYTVCNIIIDTINLVNNQVTNEQDIAPFQFDLCFVATDFRDESFNADGDGDDGDDDGYDDDDDEAKGDAKSDGDNDRKEENGVIINDIEFSLKQSKMKYSKSKFDNTRVNQSFIDHIKDNKKLTHKRFVCVNDFRVNERFVISDDNDFNFQIKPPQGQQLLYEKFFGLTLGKLFPNYWNFKTRKNDNDRPDILKTLPFGISSKTEWLKSVFAKSNQNSEHKMQESTLVNKIGHEMNIASIFDLMKKSDDEIKDLLKKYQINDTAFDEMKSEMDKLKVIFMGDLTGKNQNSDLFTISFHVHSQNEIKAYILWGGQCLRFFPCDLLTIFKTWFQYKPNNDKETRLKSDVKNLYLKDYLFESFCVASLKPEIYKDMFPN